MGNIMSILAPWANTVGGWMVVCVLIGVVVRNWNQKQKKIPDKSAAQKAKQERHQITSKKENKESKPKRQRLDDTQRDSYASKLKSQPPAQTYPSSYSSDDDQVNNREFAKQLASVKQGTKFTPKAKNETRQKSVKQSRAQEMPKPANQANVSAPSSTAGVDADDDQSSAASPLVGAAEAGNVDDMLETPTAGPSVLRLTGTEEKKSKAKKTKEPEEVETKKQRQNRKKTEAAKAEREAAEKERKVLMEAQRRRAREAEGRPAKDGSSFTAAQPKTNAWTEKAVNGGTNGEPHTNGFMPTQPLDTGDVAREKNGKWIENLPSEEEQMEMIRKQDDEWNTVKAKPRKAKKNEAAAESNDETPVPAQAVASTASQPAKKPQGAAMNNRPTKAFAQQSSFSALRQDSPAGEEEEWDV